MATHRNPKGVYSRPTSDFYSDHAAAVGSSFYNGGGVNNYTFYNCSLFNNSNTGAYLFIQRIDYFQDGATSALMKFAGGSYGSFVCNGQSAYSDRGTPPGALYVNAVNTGVSVFNTAIGGSGAAGLFGLGEAGSTSSAYFFGHPLVLAPGMSLIIYPNFPGADASVGFYYVWLAGTN